MKVEVTVHGLLSVILRDITRVVINPGVAYLFRNHKMVHDDAIFFDPWITVQVREK